MYTKTEYFNYFDGFYKSLGDAKQRKLLVLLIKTVCKSIGSPDIDKMHGGRRNGNRAWRICYKDFHLKEGLQKRKRSNRS